MTDHIRGEAPKPGAFVQTHIPDILAYIEGVDPDEFERLLTKDHSQQQMRLSYPFFKATDAILVDGDSSKYWKRPYVVRGVEVRICSQWTVRHRPFVFAYMAERGIEAPEITTQLREEWLAKVEQAGTSAKSPGGARYRTYAIGVAQNAVVRYLLSNIGYEEFKKVDWESAKSGLSDACVYCGASGQLQMDHAVPLSRLQMGEHRLGNLVPACRRCNSEKSQLRYRPYLEAKYEGAEAAAQRRIDVIEEHMAACGYGPLEDRQDVRDLLEKARQEVAEVAARHLELINRAVARPL